MKHSGLQDNLELYSQLFNTVGNPIFVKDEHHRFVMVNDAFCSLMQVRREEFVGKMDSELFPVKEWRIFRKMDVKILTTGIPFENEEYATTPDGVRLRVLTRKSLFQTSSRRKYVLGVVTDITEKAQLLEQLKESTKKYKTIFELGSDPTGLFTYPGRVAVEVNNAYLKTSKAPRKSIIGNTATHAFQWIDPDERDRFFKRIEMGKKVRNMEIRLRNYAGEVIPFLISSTLLRINGKSYVLFTLRDISAQNKAEEMLRESETMYREMVDLSPIPMFIHRDGVIVFANDAAVSFAGILKGKLIGKKINEIVKVPVIKGERQNVTLLFEESAQSGEENDVLLETREGISRNYLIRNARIRYKGTEAFMTKILDITERQILEKYLFNKILEAEENERRRFASDLHDDLGPLLSTFKLHLGRLEKARDPERTHKSIKTFEELLNEVIRKVHEISHLISPHLIEDFGLEGAVTDLCQQINEQKVYCIRFRHNLSQERFPRDIELHYYRIIGELLNNSMKHSGCREMVIDLNYTGGLLKLKYFDQGRGYKVREILSTSKGIGISNLIHRVSLMNGEIEFRNLKGRTVVVVNTRTDAESAQRTRHQSARVTAK